MSSFFEMKDINFSYTKEPLIQDFSLSLEKNQSLALLGQSGSGKSTILHVAAGFLKPDSGSIILDTKVCFDKQTCLNPEQRNIAIVFQEHCLFPHLSVKKNIEFGYQHHNLSVTDYMELIKLSHKKDSLPGELSGGQQQRVSLVRALASNPKILLLDEPFSALDENLRFALREEVKKILNELNMSSIIVTHSKEEANEFSDQIINLGT